MSENDKQKLAGQNAEAQVSQQATSRTGENVSEPEFFIDAEGVFHANLKDWNIEPEDDAGSETGKAVQEVEEKKEPQFYTLDELLVLNPSEIDIEKVPPQLKDVYENFLLGKRKKEGVSKESEIRQEQTISEGTIYDFITAEAIKRVETKLGQKFDEFNPKHQAIFVMEVNNLYDEVSSRIRLQKEIAEIKAKEPYFDEIDAYAQEKLQSLPVKDYTKIVMALQEGNFEPLLKFWEACRKEFYAMKLKQSASTQAQLQKDIVPNVVPNVVESPGQSEPSKIVKKINPKDFAKMTDEEKAQALIELGFV